MRQKLLVATHNPGKVREFADLLSDLEVSWLSLTDADITMEVAETGSSLAENAALKARAYARVSGLLTLADDTGLEVDALGGEPGIYPARYGGPGLTPKQRYELLLARLEGVATEERAARFRCAIALAWDDEVLAVVEGTCEGLIAETPLGEHGFGYDPIFFLPALGRTMAQLMPAEKHAVSHRGKAVRAVEPHVRRLLAGSGDFS